MASSQNTWSGLHLQAGQLGQESLARHGTIPVNHPAVLEIKRRWNLNSLDEIIQPSDDQDLRPMVWTVATVPVICDISKFVTRAKAVEMFEEVIMKRVACSTKNTTRRIQYPDASAVLRKLLADVEVEDLYYLPDEELPEDLKPRHASAPVVPSSSLHLNHGQLMTTVHRLDREFKEGIAARNHAQDRYNASKAKVSRYKEYKRLGASNDHPLAAEDHGALVQDVANKYGDLTAAEATIRRIAEEKNELPDMYKSMLYYSLQQNAGGLGH